MINVIFDACISIGQFAFTAFEAIVNFAITVFNGIINVLTFIGGLIGIL